MGTGWTLAATGMKGLKGLVKDGHGLSWSNCTLYTCTLTKSESEWQVRTTSVGLGRADLHCEMKSQAKSWGDRHANALLFSIALVPAYC